MAFNNRNTASNNESSYEKAKAFINLYIPRRNADGSVGRFKLVGVPVREGNVNEKTLLDWLQKDPANIVKLLGKMQAEMVLVNPAGAGNLCLED